MKSGAGDDPFSDEEAEKTASNDTDASVVEQEDVGDLVVENEESVEPEPTSMVDVLADNLAAVDDDPDVDNNVGFRHDRLKALLLSVDDSQKLREELAAALEEALGQDFDSEELTSSDVARALAVAGLQSGAPDVYEALGEAVEKHDGGIL